MQRLIAGSMACAILLAPKVGHVSDFVSEADLRRVCGSSIVLRVEPAKPPTVESRVPIDPKGEHPPYTRVQSRYVVLEVLRADDEAPAVGATIEVDEAGYERQLSDYRMAVLEHTNVGESYSVYRPRYRVKANEERLLFLERTKSGLAESVRGAVESTRMLRQVRACLGPSMPPRR